MYLLKSRQARSLEFERKEEKKKIEVLGFEDLLYVRSEDRQALRTFQHKDAMSRVDVRREACAGAVCWPRGCEEDV